jgi:hypothetical protein
MPSSSKVVTCQTVCSIASPELAPWPAILTSEKHMVAVVGRPHDRPMPVREGAEQVVDVAAHPVVSPVDGSLDSHAAYRL